MLGNNCNLSQFHCIMPVCDENQFCDFSFLIFFLFFVSSFSMTNFVLFSLLKRKVSFRLNPDFRLINCFTLLNFTNRRNGVVSIQSGAS